MAKEYQIIHAFGLTTRTWTFNEKYGYGCAECCTGDRCDEDCTATYKGRRKECPHCKGKGWIKKEDVEKLYDDQDDLWVKVYSEFTFVENEGLWNVIKHLKQNFKLEKI